MGAVEVGGWASQINADFTQIFERKDGSDIADEKRVF
jgi:hypothetical protein